MKLLGTRILIKPDEVNKEKITKSGIYIAPPISKKEVPSMGIVIDIAAGKWGISKGDHVLFGKYDMDVIEVEGDELRIGEIDKVFAVIA